MTEERVRIAVNRYWEVVTETRSVEDWIELFAPESIVFGTSSVRPESGRLVATGRGREYLSLQSVVTVKFGTVEVCQLGEGFAVACYICQFTATKIQRGLSAKDKTENIVNGRMTQVFGMRGDQVQIFHEHFSMPATTVV